MKRRVGIDLSGKKTTFVFGRHMNTHLYFQVIGHPAAAKEKTKGGRGNRNEEKGKELKGVHH